MSEQFHQRLCTECERLKRLEKEEQDIATAQVASLSGKVGDVNTDSRELEEEDTLAAQAASLSESSSISSSNNNNNRITSIDNTGVLIPVTTAIQPITVQGRTIFTTTAQKTAAVKDHGNYVLHSTTDGNQNAATHANGSLHEAHLPRGGDEATSSSGLSIAQEWQRSRRDEEDTSRDAAFAADLARTFALADHDSLYPPPSCTPRRVATFASS